MADFSGEVRRLMAERGMSLRALAKASNYDPSYLSKVLAGRKAASPHLARVLDDALHADGAVREAVVRPSSHPSAAGDPRLPRRAVTAADAETTRAFRDLDNRFGGAHAHKLATGYLESSVTVMLRSGSYTEDTGRQMFAAAAQLAHLAAWTAYDIGDHRHAELYFARALELASAAGDHAFARWMIPGGPVTFSDRRR